MSSPARWWLRCGVIFGIALAVRLIHLLQIRSADFFTLLLGDGARYDQWAREIAAGDWLGQEVFYQAPLYPYFLGAIYSVFGESIFAARLTQIVLGSLGCVLLAGAARRWFSPRAGLIAGIGMALYAPAIFFDGLIQKSILDGFFLCMALWIMSRVDERPTRWGGWVGLGMTFAALMLTRENALLFVPVVLLWIVIRFTPQSRTRFTFAAVFLAGMTSILLPVVIRNQVVGGEFHLTTSQFGPNFYIGNNEAANGTYQPLRPGRGNPKYERLDAKHLAEREVGHELSPGEISRFWTGKAFDYITAHPLQWMGLNARKFALLWHGRELVDTESLESYAESSTGLNLLRHVLHFGVLLPLATIGLILSWRRRRELWVIYAMIGVYAAGMLLFYVVGRYRYPLVPLLMLFAGVALAGGGRDLLALPRPRMIGIMAATISVAMFSNWPGLVPGFGNLDQRMRAVTELNLGSALLEQSRLQESLAHLARAVEADPTLAAARCTYGEVLRLDGQIDLAEQSLLIALKLDPGYAQTHAHLGNLRQGQDRVDEAIKHYRQGLVVDPLNEGIYMNLANAYNAQERFVEAEEHYLEAIRLKPDLTAAYFNYGLMLAGRERFTEAEQEFRQAIDLFPEYVDALFNLGLLLRIQGRPEEAIEVLERATVHDPVHMGSLSVLGALYGGQGRHADAIGIFEQVLRVKQDFDEAHFNLGIALNLSGQGKRALVHIRESVRMRPGTPVRMTYLAGMLATHADESIRNPEEAIEIAEIGATLTDRLDPNLLDTLAAAYAAAGRFEEAVATAQEASDVARAAGLTELADSILGRKAMYVQGQPYVAPKVN